MLKMVIHAITFSALALGVCAGDLRVAAAGGGRVVIAPGVHPIGTLRLRSHVELHLEKGAVLLGSTKREDYDDFPRDVCSVSPESSYRALIQAWMVQFVRPKRVSWETLNQSTAKVPF